MKSRFPHFIFAFCAGATLAIQVCVPVLAQIVPDISDWKKAEQTYKESIISAKSSDERASILQEFALRLISRKDYEEAEPVLAQCLSIRRQKSECDLSTLQTLSNLALVKHKLKKEEEAESLYKECLALKRKVCPNSSSLALTLTNLANLYSEARRPTDAELLYLEAFEIDKKLGGENHLECGQDLFNLGGMYYKCNEPKKALPFFNQAQKIFEACGPSCHEQLVRVLHYSALCHSTLQEHQKSVEYNEKALLLQESTKGAKHADTAIHLLNLAHAKAKMGKASEAESLYVKALERVSNASTPDELKMCECNTELANFYRQQKKYAKAEEFYKKALAHYQKLSKHEKRGLYSLPHSYSVMLDQLKRSEESHQMAHDYLHVFKPHQKPHPHKGEQH
jgi:tetratricopeptide (TPR) repeat protein